MDLRLVSAVMPAPLVLVGLVFSAACIAKGAPPDKGLAASPAVAPAAPTPQPVSAVSPAQNQAAATDAATAPPGYIRVHASEVVPTREGEVVLLLDEKEIVAIPIFIGGSEASSIRLRLAKRRYERPLTHDLLDSLMREVGAQLLKVQVDDLKASTFLGSVFVRAGGRVFELDARPSDAIALALGSRVPIFVACRVIAATAIPRGSFLDAPGGPESDLQVEGCPPKGSPSPPLRTTGPGI
jgi:hypothetical protein